MIIKAEVKKMSRTMNSFLDEYRYADMTKRLYLFLQYPELRFEFAQIEQSEVAPVNSAIRQDKPQRRRQRDEWMHREAFAWMRWIFSRSQKRGIK